MGPFQAIKMPSRINQNKRVLVYCCMIVVCSVLTISEAYKIEKKNILNQWFVKLGWFWTNLLLLPLHFISIDTEDREGVSRSIFRLVTSSMLWYLSVNAFQYLDEATGFDISGHTFLLVFSNLIIESELKLFNLTCKNKSDNDKKSTNLMSQEAHNSSHLHVRSALLVLSALWDFMLLQTTLFYHTFIQKIIGAIWAIGSWYILDVLFYQDFSIRPKVRRRGDR